jgi:hypothetical protein
MVAVRSGDSANGLENSTALEDLRAHLTDARRAITVLDRALSRLTVMAPGKAEPVDAVLARHPIARAVEHLEKAASLGRDVAIAQEWNRDLGVDSALPDARAIRDRITRARRRLTELAGAEPGQVATSSLLEQRLGVDAEPIAFAYEGRSMTAPPRARLGASLQLAVFAVLEPRAKGDNRDMVTRFGAALLHLCSAGTPEPTHVDLGALAESLRRLPDSATRRFSSPVWAATVLGRLQETATPVHDRQQPMTDEAATAMRVPALVLAAEAVHAEEDALAADLRQLAAATCLLRGRPAHPSLLETLILAAA